MRLGGQGADGGSWSGRVGKNENFLGHQVRTSLVVGLRCCRQGVRSGLVVAASDPVEAIRE